MENKEMVIVDDLMNQIAKKELTPGSKLPSENELVNQYKVPRMTVRNALNRLEERGYIFSVQGKGRYLKDEAIQIQLALTGSTSFSEKMQGMGYDYRSENIGFSQVAYEPALYEKLQAAREERVYRIGRLRFINNEPIAIHYSYVREANFPSIVVDGPNIESMFAYYREQGYHAFSSHQTLLSVTFPTIEEQRILHCKSMVPLLVVETNSVDKETNTILECTKIIYRSDRFKYDIT